MADRQRHIDEVLEHSRPIVGKEMDRKSKETVVEQKSEEFMKKRRCYLVVENL